MTSGLLNLFAYGLRDLLFLLSLGIAGWAMFALIRSPVPPLFGTLAVVGTLRVLLPAIPMPPVYLSPVVQTLLGIYIGARITRQTVRQLKSLALPAIVVSAWALALVFAFGSLLGRLTWLDVHTAVLSSSVGGLPEMMVLSMATGADVAVVIVMQTFRLLITIALFPLLFRKMFTQGTGVDRGPYPRMSRTARFREGAQAVTRSFIHRPHHTGLSLAVAASGGWALTALGVPAGMMVGAMLATAGASVAGLPVRSIHPLLFNLLLVALGIMVSGYFGPHTAETLSSGNLIWPMLFSTSVVLLTSLCVARIIHRLAGWDMPTSFLAAAPGGLTVMTTLAIQYDKNPFQVSMVHLARLLAIKTVVPFVFMLFV
ncbi:MAG: hypothetical protein EA384_03805 [Spirochaetaceae bacterium]|nr:MAG: hypothetical protein EA384_03805 [Spirochaetaceae bacterium]